MVNFCKESKLPQSVYLTNPFIQPIIPLLMPQWRIIQSWQESDVNKHQINALATTVWDKIDAAYLSQFPQLRVICHLGLGTDNIDKQYLQQHEITLFSQPHAGIHDTAELAFTLMLTLARKMIANDHYTRANHWVENKPKVQGNHLFGKQLGLVGLGQIGSTIAQFAQAFGMKVAYTARSKRNNIYTYFSDVDSLAKNSDFLIICCSGGPETHHLVNKAVLDNLGVNGYLINVARGSIVDQNALIEALIERRIAGAGLDVYADEPRVPEALRSLDNVVLSPHMGSSTQENLNNMFQLQAKQLNQYLQQVLQTKDSTQRIVIKALPQTSY